MDFSDTDGFHYIEEITGVKDLIMAYSKYEESIAAVYKVVIDGWPEDIPWVSPQSLTKVEDVKELYEVWSEEQACWQKLTSKQVRELKAQREPVAERVKQVKKKQTGARKEKCTHVEDDDNDSDEALSSEDQVRVHGGKRKSSADMAESRKRRRLGGDKEVGKDGMTKAKSSASKIASRGWWQVAKPMGVNPWEYL